MNILNIAHETQDQSDLAKDSRKKKPGTSFRSLQGRLDTVINRAYSEGLGLSSYAILREAKIPTEAQRRHPELYQQAEEAARSLKRFKRLNAEFKDKSSAAIAHLRLRPGLTAESLARCCGYNIERFDRQTCCDARRFVEWLVRTEKLQVVAAPAPSKQQLYLADQKLPRVYKGEGRL